jgi:HK97 family phage portal protein
MGLMDALLKPFGFVKAEALPVPASMYPASGGGIITAGPLAFPGWDVWRSGTETDKGRAATAIQSGWVYSDIKVIAHWMSAAELIVKQQTTDGLQDIENQPLEVMWKRPNPWMSPSFVVQYWAWQLLLFGEAYLYFAPQGNDLAEVWPVPSLTVEPVGTADEFISSYHLRFHAGEKPIPMDRRYICYSNFPNPTGDIRRGLSPLASAFGAIDSDLKQATWNRNFFGKRNAMPSAIVTVPPSTPQDFERTRQELYDWYGGGRREIAVTQGGGLDFKVLGLAHRDMDFLAGRAFSRDEIDRVYGFPAGYWDKGSTEANATHAKATVIENAVWPNLVMLAQDLTSQIVAPWWGPDMSVEFADIRPANVELQLKQTESRSAYWTIAELRAADGKPPLGDERDNLVAIELRRPAASLGLTMPTTPEPTAGKSLADPRLAIRAELGKWQRKAAARLRAGKAVGDFDSDVIPQGLKSLMEQRLAGNPERAFACLKVLEDDRVSAEAVLEKLIKAVLAHHWGTTAEAINNGHDPNLKPLQDELMLVLARNLGESAEDQIARDITTVGVDFDVATINLAASQWARTYTGGLLEGLSSTTQQIIKAAIAKFVETPGMTIGDVTDSLAGAFGPKRANQIAITETTRAFSQGTSIYQGLLKDAGIDMDRIWNASQDELVCKKCGPFNGKKESLWGDMYPDGPPAHTSCRCWLTLASAR